MPGVYSVTQINAYIRNLFARDFALRDVTVRGEISNLKYHSSGHIYFTLKDENAAIACVMFASRRNALTFPLKEGQRIEARGQISVFEKAGSYQLYVQGAALTGQGELYQRFLALKKELEEMGMFDPIYKKPLPKYAMRIGIVTAATGAAIRDIINISKRRNPYVELVLCESLVQGPNAAPDIVRAIRKLDKMGLDVIIVGRGGGSIEDLWAFNEESVARAVFDAETPVVSAVGHETDFTITDFVADLRAPTPSAAAELCNFEYDVFMEQLSAFQTALQRDMQQKIRETRGRLSEKALRFEKRSPRATLAGKRESLAHRSMLLNRIMKQRREALSGALSVKRDRLDVLIRKKAADAGERLGRYPESLRRNAEKKLLLARHGYTERAGRLDAMSPLKRISGGFGFVTDSGGRAIRSVDSVTAGESIRIRLKDGRIGARVEETAREVSYGRTGREKAGH